MDRRTTKKKVVIRIDGGIDVDIRVVRSSSVVSNLGRSITKRKRKRVVDFDECEALTMPLLISDTGSGSGISKVDCSITTKKREKVRQNQRTDEHRISSLVQSPEVFRHELRTAICKKTNLFMKEGEGMKKQYLNMLTELVD